MAKPCFLILFLLMGLLLAPACSGRDASPVPSDFAFLLDVDSTDPGSAHNVHIVVDASGNGHYEYYDTGGVLQYDTNGILTYAPSQVVSGGDFELSDPQLLQLWEAIQANKFFELEDDYQMALGSSYAFILVQAEGRKHWVNNIGMEVPEIRTIVEAAQELMPKGVEFEYGDGYEPK